MENLGFIILATLGISIVLNSIFKKINIDTIIGYIFTGTIITTIFSLNDNLDLESLNIIAEFGIVFLMFTIGLEFSAEKLKSIKKEVFIYGPLQFFITGGLFFSLSYFIFDLPTITSIIVSLGLSLSSTAIVLKLLAQNKTLHKVYGKNATGVLLFQDLIVIPILIFISIAGNTQGETWAVINNTLMNAVILTAIFTTAGAFVVKPLLNFIYNTKSDEIFVSTLLFIIIGSAALAHHLGFSFSLGAFIIGLIIARTNFKHQIESDLIPFRDLLLGIFFITVGMQIDLAFIPENIGKIFAIITLVVLLKMIIIFAIMRADKHRKKSSIKTAIILSQVGEFSFVIFEMAKINGLFVNESHGQLLIVSIIFSMILTPFVFNNIQKIADWFDTETTPTNDTLPDGFRLKNHVIVCGYGILGQKITHDLAKLNFPYITIERNHSLVNLGLDENKHVILGKPSNKKILNSLKIEQAQVVIVTTQREDRTMNIIKNIREIDANIKIIAKGTSQEEINFLNEMGNIEIINEIDQVSKSMIKKLKIIDSETN